MNRYDDIRLGLSSGTWNVIAAIAAVLAVVSAWPWSWWIAAGVALALALLCRSLIRSRRARMTRTAAARSAWLNRWENGGSDDRPDSIR